MKSSLKGRKGKRTLGDDKKVRKKKRVALIGFEDAMSLKDNEQFAEFEKSLREICCFGRNMDDRVQSTYELALFYCQTGVFDKADLLLRTLGFEYRLGQSIWNLQTINDKQSKPPSVCFDNIFPSFMLESLLNIFGADSSFWTEHGYPSSAFFSYNTSIASSNNPQSSANNIISQLADCLRPLVAESFPGLDTDGLTSVEWWAHTRPDGPSAGHRLHYDTDEVALNQYRSEGNAASASVSVGGSNSIHPLVSSVIYLDDGGSSGAPTLLIDQHLDGVKSHKAWVCRPSKGRLLLFDGRLLHGVVPHIRSESTRDMKSKVGPRLTLMIGWWGKQVHTTPYSPSTLRPNMNMPSCSGNSSSYATTWPSLFSPLGTKKHEKLLAHVRSVVQSSDAISEVIGPVWEGTSAEEDSLESSASSKEGEVDREMLSRHLTDVEEAWPESGIVFMGNWFLRSESEINDEILHPSHEDSSEEVGNSDDESSSCSEGEKHHQDMGGVVGTPKSSGDDSEWMSLEDLLKLRG